MYYNSLLALKMYFNILFIALQTPVDGNYQAQTPAPHETPYYQPETPKALSVRAETPAPLSVAPPSVRTEYDISAELDRIQVTVFASLKTYYSLGRMNVHM
jgi:hypothetical protein